jgi:hypothetical protein
MKYRIESNVLFLMLAICVTETLACGDSKTSQPPPRRGWTVAVASRSSRSCEVIFLAGPEVEVALGGDVRGSSLQRGNQLAVSFISTRDATFPSAPVRFTASAGVDSAADLSSAELKLISSTCYDRLGRVIPNPGVSLRK